jgi:hypothetical protein
MIQGIVFAEARDLAHFRGERIWRSTVAVQHWAGLGGLVQHWVSDERLVRGGMKS